MSRCVKCWAGLTQMQNHRYPKQRYTMLSNLDNVGRVTGASHIRQLLFHTGFGYAWIVNGVGSIPVFLNSSKNRLQNQQSKINETSKSAYYKHYTSIVKVEQYLYIDLPVMYKRALSNFRCSGPCLMIEKWRNLNLDKDYCYCPVCLPNGIRTVEDEMFLLLICPRYNNLRKDSFPTQWQTTLCANGQFIKLC